MAFQFKDLKEKAQALCQTGLEKGSSLAQTGLGKAQQVSAMAKLKAANLSEEETLRRAYQELGRLYFEKHGSAPEEEFLGVCATIDEALATIQINQAKLEELAADFSGVAPVTVVPEAQAEQDGSAPSGESDPVADLDAFIKKANADADSDGNA